jgi:penicillin amidase
MNRLRLFLPTLAILIFSFAVQAKALLPGLEAPATVVRDTNGIPHILAANEHDLYFMQGRIHAQDRLFQMDLLRRSAVGTLAELLGSDDFSPAFGGSTNQDDYRWGRLHRIVFKHALGGVEANFNVPPAFGFVPAPLADLAGIPVDGGFETVDEGPPLDANNIRVGDSDSFMFDFGPTGRFVARLEPDKVKGETSLPGGESAIPGNPFYLNLLESWLRNETFQMLVSPDELQQNAISIVEFGPSGP